MLESEEDFAATKAILEEELEKLGAKCIFTPKYHPELNPIECCYRFSQKISLVANNSVESFLQGK